VGDRHALRLRAALSSISAQQRLPLAWAGAREARSVIERAGVQEAAAAGPRLGA
jgi:hypothetical protein